jgi:hypothetical protein
MGLANERYQKGSAASNSATSAEVALRLIF